MAERPTAAADIRRAFLEFYAERGHTQVPSGPLVPPNDPSLYFANAGMVQFKDLFTGREKRAYRRATTSQKCMRVSGKHNDLETVGTSPNHHTLFEMLGNFSFGDYFKREAIEYAWAFVTEVLQLPRERLLVTYLRAEGELPADEEAREIWRQVSGLPEERIVGCGAADNFWRMGDTGPCGPCSEIFYFRGDPIDPARFDEPTAVDGTGWMEIWNLVFMQFDRSADGSLAPLPAPCVDTGMGLERIARVQQQKDSNYDTDLFQPLVQLVAEIAGKPYRGSQSHDDTSMRVIADHARAAALLIADGVLPDRAGRAYVLRRVMRRAIRHGHRLGIERPFLHQVALRVVEMLGSHFTELRARRAVIESVTEQEESRFRQTIERGLGLLDESFETISAAGRKVLQGADAFKLYDTYGFPLDLTEVICAERGFSVDHEGYEASLQSARALSEFRGRGEAVAEVYRSVQSELADAVVEFTGYESLQESSTVLALVADGKRVEAVAQGMQAEVIVARSPFYAEAGGQVGDSGLVFAEGVRFDVRDTQAPLDGLRVHLGSLAQGRLQVGDAVRLQVDPERRRRTRQNHSATHLLHWALRQVLGEGAQQKGSLVGPDRLRFDFTFGRSLTHEQLTEIEDRVNVLIFENHPVLTQVLSLEEARERGATMLFEEKYGDTVRVLTMGPSVELCGGTHARATGQIGVLKVLQEQGVAAGVRRIVATTGPGVLGYVRQLESTLADASRLAKASPAELVDKLERMLTQQKGLEKQVEQLQRSWLSGGGGLESMLSKARDVSGARVLAARTEVTDRGALRELAEQLRDRLGEGVVLVASVHEQKAQLVLAVSKSLTGRFQAGKLIRPIAERLGGSGGGRPDMAQAGGTEVDQLDAALESLYREVGAASSN